MGLDWENQNKQDRRRKLEKKRNDQARAKARTPKIKLKKHKPGKPASLASQLETIKKLLP